jgi:hypothetical protein
VVLLSPEAVASKLTVIVRNYGTPMTAIHSCARLFHSGIQVVPTCYNSGTINGPSVNEFTSFRNGCDLMF